MSDSFGSLLKQLKNTAQVAAKAKQEVEERRKRPREYKDDDTIATKDDGHPPKHRLCVRDLQELTIRVSFLVIGAQKAGTSWLHEMLSRHPQLKLPASKELHFWDWNRSKGLAWYSRKFIGEEEDMSSTAGARNSNEASPFFGEITPCYAVLLEHDIREIRQLFPDVKIIFVARDIVDRTWVSCRSETRNTWTLQKCFLLSLNHLYTSVFAFSNFTFFG